MSTSRIVVILVNTPRTTLSPLRSILQRAAEVSYVAIKCVVPLTAYGRLPPHGARRTLTGRNRPDPARHDRPLSGRPSVPWSVSSAAGGALLRAGAASIYKAPL